MDLPPLEPKQEANKYRKRKLKMTPQREEFLSYMRGNMTSVPSHINFDERAFVQPSRSWSYAKNAQEA